MWCWYFIRKLKIIVAWNCNHLFCIFFSQSRHLCKILFFFWCIDCGNNKKWSSHSFVIFLEFFFLSVWFYVGMAGAFCFILIQLVLLIDFVHSWNESWVEKMEEGNSRCWYADLLSATALNHLLSLVAIILFFVYYTHPASCAENKAFISVNMLLCLGASIMSILPKIQVSLD